MSNGFRVRVVLCVKDSLLRALYGSFPCAVTCGSFPCAVTCGSFPRVFSIVVVASFSVRFLTIMKNNRERTCGESEEIRTTHETSREESGKQSEKRNYEKKHKNSRRKKCENERAAKKMRKIRKNAGSHEMPDEKGQKGKPLTN